MNETKPIVKAALSYTEREAIAVLRKSIVRKPEIIHELMRGQTQEVATNALVMVHHELNVMLQISRTFKEAAAMLAAAAEKEKGDGTG